MNENSDRRNRERLGELGGGWALMFKFFEIVIPIAVGGLLCLCVWIIREIHTLQIDNAGIRAWMNQGPRFTTVDADKLRLQIVSDTKNGFEVKLDDVIKRLGRVEVLLETHMITVPKVRTDNP